MSLREKQKSASKDDLINASERVAYNPGSPIIDVETLSDEEYPKESTQSQRLSLTDTSNLDSSGDQRVLTLAEQFLAAMPARYDFKYSLGLNEFL